MSEYRDSASGSAGLGDLGRLFSASFRVGRFFGVELRVLWLTVIIFPVSILVAFTGWPPLLVLTAFVACPLLLVLVIYSHEMGHVVAGWRYRIHTPLITISPLGGLAHMGARTPGPKSDLFVTLAGPAVHLAWLAVFYPVSRVVDVGYASSPWEAFWRWFPDFVVRVNLALLLFNLLPIFPLDGGRALRALLSFRLHANRATLIAARIGQVGAVGIGIYGLIRGGVWSAVSIALAFRIFMDCRRAIMEARFGEGPWGEVREAWQADPDGWKLGGTRPAREPTAREKKRERREQQDREAVAAEVDRLLEKISDVGIGELTRAEKKFLKKASKRMGNRG